MMPDLHQSILARLRTDPDGLPFYALRPLHESGGAVQEALRDLEASLHVERDPETERYRLIDFAPASESPEAPAAVTEHVAAAGLGVALDRCGLPASKIPGLEDEIRVLTLDDVAMPLVDAASAAAIVERIEAQSTATLPPPPPRGHPALGVGPSWSDRIAALEERLSVLETERARRCPPAIESLADRIRELTEAVRVLECEGLHPLARRVERLEHPAPIGPIAPPLGDHVEALKERSAVVAWIRVFAASDIGCDVSEYLEAIANDVEAGRHLPVKP